VKLAGDEGKVDNISVSLISMERVGSSVLYTADLLVCGRGVVRGDGQLIKLFSLN